MKKCIISMIHDFHHFNYAAKNPLHDFLPEAIGSLHNAATDVFKGPITDFNPLVEKRTKTKMSKIEN